MKYLTMTIIFDGSNLNYGEGFGNVLNLKKLSYRGKNYSYISRQALRYDIVRLMNQDMDIKLTPTDKKGGVIQFTAEAKIDEYPEIDFFGYMKTSENKIRKAVVRLTDAVSLEPYNNDMDFATNKGLADRIKDNVGNDIFQSEYHKSYYSYTITTDLDKIGEDPNYDISLGTDEKVKRLNMLLDSVKLVNRDIRGKRENLNPIFVIGGVYDIGNPFFYNRVEIDFKMEKSQTKAVIKDEIINSVLQTTFKDKAISEQTTLGAIDGVFDNIDKIDVKQKTTTEGFFKSVKTEIEKYYKG
jgi:CRISPR-associated protein Cst2